MSEIEIFLSVGEPHTEFQELYLKRLEGIIKRRGLRPLTLGRSDYDVSSPLNPVKKMMDRCKGAIILGFERTHCLIGYDKEDSKNEKEFTHRYLSTPWNQIEAGMAYQKGVPILIMKESHLEPYGILDPKLTGFYVYELNIKNEVSRFSKGFLALLDKWIDSVEDFNDKNKQPD
jgi:hypothetical protein